MSDEQQLNGGTEPPETQTPPLAIKNTPPAADFYSDIANEYKAKGVISDDFKNSVISKGLTAETLENIVSGLEAKTKIEKLEADKILNDIYQSVGGKEQIETIKTWASKNLQKEEIEAVNKVSDPQVIKLIYGALKTKMETSEGKTPEYLEGKGAEAKNGDVFQSKAQMITAIQDARYKKDPAYRKQVSDKIKRSYTQGINLNI